MDKTVYLNRNTATSSSDKGAYKLSVIATNTSNKDALKEVVKSNIFSKIVTINETTNTEELCKNFIICPSIFKKDALTRRDIDIDYSKFIFIDIDNGMTIQEAKAILDSEELSYILYTSMSHKEEHHKFHILVPTLKKIDSKEDYKAYWQYLHELFEFKTDKSCNTPSKASYPSAKDGLVIDKMYRNDLYLTAKELKIYKKVVASYESSENNPSSVAHLDYVKMIKNSNPSLSPVDNTNTVLRFKRDENDSIGNLFNYYSKDEKHIIDNTKDGSTDLLFCNSDFLNAVKPDDKVKLDKKAIENFEGIMSDPILSECLTKEQADSYKAEVYNDNCVQENIQKQISTSISDLVYARDYIGLNSAKMVIVANEGVGKSRSVIEICKSTPIIYAADTKDRIKEIKESLDNENITNLICFSNSEILEQLGYDKDFIQKFELAMKKDISANKFLDKNLSIEEAISVKNVIEENNKKIERTDITVLLTTKKLKVLLLQYQSKSNLSLIVLDEFEVSDFYPLSVDKSYTGQKGTKVDTFYSNQIEIYENRENLFDLLIGKNALILSTELEKVKRVFYGKSDYAMRDYSELLRAYNVNYILTSSTSNVENDAIRRRDKVIKKVKELHSEVSKVISNNSSEADLSHKAVRGSNSFKQETTLVVGHYPSATEQYLFYEAAKEYYNDTFGDDLDSIADDISYTIMGTQISQSIGRNSGFRESGAKCYVLLPILAPNSPKCFKKRCKQKMELHLKYVSPNIERLAS